MYSSSVIKKEANTEASWAAGAPEYASAAVPRASTHAEGVEGRLSQRNINFLFVVIVILSLAIFIATYCIAYIMWCFFLRQGDRHHNYSHSGRSGTAAMRVDAERNIGNGGLEASLVRSLPILQYRCTEESRSAKGLQVQNECAVCLSEFEAGEEMKMLPVCAHCFHKSCIDTWLLSHATCPICRLSLLEGGHGSSSSI